LTENPTPSQAPVTSTPSAASSSPVVGPAPYPYIAGLSILATLGLVVMWWVFWSAIAKTKESAHDVLMSPSFFRVVTVMGVIAATVVLSLAGRLEGNITGAILSGIVGYVLGQMHSPARSLENTKEPPKAA